MERIFVKFSSIGLFIFATASATQLPIAAARVEDLQPAIEYHAERAADIETEVAQKEQQLAETILKHAEAC